MTTDQRRDARPSVAVSSTAAASGSLHGLLAAQIAAQRVSTGASGGVVVVVEILALAATFVGDIGETDEPSHEL